MFCIAKIVLGVTLGVGGGYGASRLLCIGGGCPLTSNRPLMMALGGLLGVWIAWSVCRAGIGTVATPAAGEPTTPEQFKARVVDPGRPAVVDFHATWCGPCRELAPIFDALEARYEGRIAFFRVDIDRAKVLAREQQVETVPTLVLYRDGQEFRRVSDALTEDVLVELLEELLARP